MKNGITNNESKVIGEFIKNISKLNIPTVIGIIYNERPKDRPVCPKCGKILSPAGGALDGSIMYWVCWDCDYKLEDIPSHCL